MFQNKGILIVEGKHADHVFTPTDAIMVLPDEILLSDFKDQAISVFKSEDFIIDYSVISGGESISLFGPTLPGRKTTPIKITLKLYQKLKKVMVQGSSNSVELWVQKFYKIAKARSAAEITNAEANLNSENILPLITPHKENETESTKNDTPIGVQSGETGQIATTNDAPSNPEEMPKSPEKSVNLKRTELSIQLTPNRLTPKREALLSDLKNTVSLLETKMVSISHETQNKIDHISKKLVLIDELAFLKDEINKIKSNHKVEIAALKQDIKLLESDNEALKKKINQLDLASNKSKTSKDQQINSLHKSIEDLQQELKTLKNHENLSAELPLHNVKGNDNQHLKPDTVLCQLDLSNKFEVLSDMEDNHDTSKTPDLSHDDSQLPELKSVPKHQSVKPKIPRAGSDAKKATNSYHNPFLKQETQLSDNQGAPKAREGKRLLF